MVNGKCGSVSVKTKLCWVVPRMPTRRLVRAMWNTERKRFFDNSDLYGVKPLRDGCATCTVLRDRDTAEFSCGEVTVNPPSMNILDPVFYSHI